jgi:spermidine/putrescine transport system permease protein
MTVFALIPSLFLILLAFSDLSLFDLGSFSLTLQNFSIIGLDTTLKAMQNSLEFALITAVICFLIGYPVALYLTTLKEKTRKILIALLIVPLWSNMLLRINAWEKIFTPSSIFTDIFGISFNLLGEDIAIIIAMVAMYLPFMIFPIFSVLEKLDIKLIEAAKDLGANDIQTFFRVIFPLSAGGIVSGTIMTFLPAMTAFALPQRISLGKTTFIGNIIESKFRTEVMDFNGVSINQGSMISLFLMLFSVTAFILIVRFDKEGETLI